MREGGKRDAFFRISKGLGTRILLGRLGRLGYDSKLTLLTLLEGLPDAENQTRMTTIRLGRLGYDSELTLLALLEGLPDAEDDRQPRRPRHLPARAPT